MIYREGIESLEKEMNEKDHFEKYRNDPDPEKRKRADAWGVGIGLQAVDGLHVSDYLISVAMRHIEGEITIKEAQKLIEEHYKS